MFALHVLRNLLNPRLLPQAIGSGVSPRMAVLFLILTTTLLRCGWAAALETSNDEAYNFLYTVYPDWSQFDHPPVTMLIEQFGLAFFGSKSPFALRFGFVLIGAASTWVMARWTASRFGEWGGFHAALALNLTGFFMVKAGVFAQPDGPAVLFTLLTLWALDNALEQPPRVRPWLLVGLAWAGAMASKYTTVFLPAGAVAVILLTPGMRRHLRSPGPYLAVTLGVLGFVPVLLWNAGHEWASFAFQSQRGQGFQFRPLKGFSYLAEQAGQWLPWMWVALHGALFTGLRNFRSLSLPERHWICQAMIPLGLFLFVAMTKGAMAHWAFLGFLPLFPLLGRTGSLAMADRPRATRRKLSFAGGFVVLLMVAIALQARCGILVWRGDPTRDLSGWRSVGTEFENRGWIDWPHTFVFTTEWEASGHLGFELHPRMPVLCYRTTGARSFAYWTRPGEWTGWDGLLIDSECRPGMADHFRSYFRSVELLAEFPMTRGGTAMGLVQVYLCRDLLHPFPFAQ